MLSFSRTEVVTTILLCVLIGGTAWMWRSVEASEVPASPSVPPPKVKPSLPPDDVLVALSRTAGSDGAPFEAVEEVKRFSRPTLQAKPTLDPQNAFLEIDVDQSGALSEAEFAVHFLAEEQQKYRPSDVSVSADGLARAKAKFARDDEDQDGRLSEEEFGAGKFRIDLSVRAEDDASRVP